MAKSAKKVAEHVYYVHVDYANGLKDLYGPYTRKQDARALIKAYRIPKEIATIMSYRVEHTGQVVD